MTGGRPRLGHRDLTACPPPSELDRPSGTIVARPRLFEAMEHVLGAIRRPTREKVVVLVGQTPPAPHGHEPGITDLREDHVSPMLGRMDRRPPKGAGSIRRVSLD